MAKKGSSDFKDIPVRDGMVKIERAWLDKNRSLKIKGDHGATDASHVLDVAMVQKLLDGYVKVEDAKPLQDLMQDFLNLPLKSYEENRRLEKQLDQEIMDKLGTQTPLSQAANDRVEVKLGLVKGLALDMGTSEETVRSILCPLGSLIGPDGQPIDHKYPSCWKDMKPYNLWSHETPSRTGLTKAGEPHRGTAEGKARLAKTFEQECGMTKTQEASERSNIGKKLGIPKNEYKAKCTGKKVSDGSWDMRTRLGVAGWEHEFIREWVKEEKAEKQLQREEQQTQNEEGQPRHREQELQEQQEQHRREEQQRRHEQQRRQEEEAQLRRQEQQLREQQEQRRREEQRRQQLLFEEQRRQEQRRREEQMRAESMFSHAFSQPSRGFPGTHIGFHTSTGSANGREVFRGSRGGEYHLSRNGNRVYH